MPSDNRLPQPPTTYSVLGKATPTPVEISRLSPAESLLRGDSGAGLHFCIPGGSSMVCTRQALQSTSRAEHTPWNSTEKGGRPAPRPPCILWTCLHGTSARHLSLGVVLAASGWPCDASSLGSCRQPVGAGAHCAH